jgi:hypothetical protein
MTDEDEVFVERCFQRSLLVRLFFFVNACDVTRGQELEKLISYSGTPTVIWRRTGEICLVAPEFCMLTEWPMEELVGRRKYIYEVTPRSSSFCSRRAPDPTLPPSSLSVVRKPIRGRVLGKLCLARV